ncbi:MAG: kynureninase [Candidatus Heimdallarchaeota archaeon]|nr:kynureninase [Candidatus Heimdallarchaeota archaeon]
MNFEATIEFANKMDEEDQLKEFRNKFFIPKKKDGSDSIYLCGNSLGLQPKSVKAVFDKELDSWANNGVKGHFNDTVWAWYHEDIGKSFENIVGAKPEEIAVMNTLTVNLHLMMVSFYKPTKDRYKIIIEGSAFPSDQYAVKSQIKFHGYNPKDALIELHIDKEEGIIPHEKIETIIREQGDSVALIMLGGVNYYTGQVFDMKRITELGHDQGCIVGFDLAHAAGNVLLELHNWNVDFAVWCNYKYLNSGPGAIAGCFVHERHGNNPDIPRFAGWWGHDKETRFLMDDTFVPIAGAEGWQISNTPLFSMAPIKSSTSIFNEAGMKSLVIKSEKLTNYLQFLIERIASDNIWITPKNSDDRGCQISVHVREGGKDLYQKLTEKGVICDWREPDVIRIAPIPLYNSFADVYHFYEILKTSVN